MPIQVLRPDGTVSAGNWTIIGPAGTTVHGALSDNSDVTMLRSTQISTLANQVATMTVQDVSLPAGSKIFGVRVRVRQAVIQGPPGGPNPPPPRPHCGWIISLIIDILTMNITKFFRDLFDWRPPTKPPPKPADPAPPTTWETVELSYATQDPAGNEWSQESFNDFKVFLGRYDTNTTQLNISEVYIDLDYNQKPVCTATGPTGSITDKTRALVTWTYADPESDKQQGYWIRLFTSDIYSDPGFNPSKSTPFDESVAVGSDLDGGKGGAGSSAGGASPQIVKPGGTDPWVLGEDTTWISSRDLPNGTYRAYVKVQQVWNGFGTHESDWSFIQWTQAVPGPVNPTLLATYDPDLNRVKVDASVTSVTPATATYNLEFSDNAGVTYQLLRDGEQIPVTPVTLGATLYDYEAPLNQLRKYRAQGFRILNSIKVSSGFSVAVDATPQTVDFWLKDPLAPGLNTILPVMADKPKRPRLQGIFAPLTDDGAGQQFKVAITGPRYGVEGQLTLAFKGNDGGWNAFNNILDSGRTLLMQSPDGQNHYVAMAGDLEWDWGLRRTEAQYRIATISYTEVRKP